MNIDHKKKVLALIIDGIQSEKFIDDCIKRGLEFEDDEWLPENFHPRPIVEPKAEKRVKKIRKVIIHGKEYPNLRHACTEVWGLTQGQYAGISKKVSSGEDINTLLKPIAKEPRRKLLGKDAKGNITVH